MSGHSMFLITLAAFLALIIFLQKKYHLLEDNGSAAVKPYSLARTQLVWWTWIVLSSLVAIVWGSGNIPTLGDSTLILLGIGALTTVSGRITDISDDNAITTSSAVTAGAQGATGTQGSTAATAATGTTPAAGAATSGTAPTSPDPKKVLLKDEKRENFFLDILSDKNGVSIHRLQAVVINLVFGLWFIHEVWTHITYISPKNFSTEEADAAEKTLKALAAQTQTPEILAKIAQLKEAIKGCIDHIIPVITQNNLILLGMSSGTYIALKTTENSGVIKTTNVANDAATQQVAAQQLAAQQAVAQQAAAQQAAAQQVAAQQAAAAQQQQSQQQGQQQGGQQTGQQEGANQGDGTQNV